jgi:hypothetical protein
MNITFPKLNDDDLYPADGTISRAMGWGTTGGFRQSKKLLEVDIPIISNEDCDEFYGGNDTIIDSNICAYQTGGGVDCCYGKCSLFMELLVEFVKFAYVFNAFHRAICKPLCRRFR